jgi:hypothetical protein
MASRHPATLDYSATPEPTTADFARHGIAANEVGWFWSDPIPTVVWSPAGSWWASITAGPDPSRGLFELAYCDRTGGHLGQGRRAFDTIDQVIGHAQRERGRYLLGEGRPA